MDDTVAPRPNNVAEAPPPDAPAVDALAAYDAEAVAYPAEADLDNIEQGILDDLADPVRTENEPEWVAPSPSAPGKVGRPPRKTKLVEDIEAFRGACPDIVPVGWKLKKTKIGDLEIILARCVSAASGHALRPNTAAVATPAPPVSAYTHRPPAPAPARPPVVGRATDGPVAALGATTQLDAPGLNGRTIAKTLCDMNVLGMEMLEFGTQVAAPYTGGVVVAGAAAELRAREEELEDIIRRVYADNKEVLDRYVSPTMAWATMMSAVALKNVKKVDETTGEVLTPQEHIRRTKAREDAPRS